MADLLVIALKEQPHNDGLASASLPILLHGVPIPVTSEFRVLSNRQFESAQ